MPTYDYVCDSCGYKLEIIQTFSEKLKRKCPECKKLKLRRIISPGIGVVFRGSGFYATDNRPKEPSVKKTTENPSVEKKGKTDSSVSSTKKNTSKP